MRSLLVAAALMTACVPPFEYDEEVCGMKVKWGPQERSTEGLCFAAEVCEEEVGVLSAGAQIEFQTNTDKVCKRRDTAGCYDPETDIIYLAVHHDLRVSALCHELVHRHLEYEKGSHDKRHEAPLWDLVPNAIHRGLSARMDELMD